MQKSYQMDNLSLRYLMDGTKEGLDLHPFYFELPFPHKYTCHWMVEAEKYWEHQGNHLRDYPINISSFFRVCITMYIPKGICVLAEVPYKITLAFKFLKKMGITKYAAWKSCPNYHVISKVVPKNEARMGIALLYVA